LLRVAPEGIKKKKDAMKLKWLCLLMFDND
jgi:hypothetical protein